MIYLPQRDDNMIVGGGSTEDEEHVFDFLENPDSTGEIRINGLEAPHAPLPKSKKRNTHSYKSELKEMTKERNKAKSNLVVAIVVGAFGWIWFIITLIAFAVSG